jgi:multicomponent Na+:H+ antiporter subunit G
MALEIASWVFLLGGAVFCIISGIGVLRLPDFYTRTHGASIADTMGAGLMLFGLVLQSEGDWLVIVKLLLVGVFLFFTSPTAGHALVKAAYAHGIRAHREEDDAA